MKTIENYRLISPIIELSGSSQAGFWEAEDEISGDGYEILWIQCDHNNPENVKIIERVFKKISALKSKHMEGIQSIFEVGLGSEEYFYIVYEKIESASEPHWGQEELNQVLQTLDRLNKRNFKGFILNEQTIIKNADKEVRLRFVGLFELFKKSIISMKEEKALLEKRTIQDDMFSVAMFFQNFLEERGQEIYTKCMEKEYGQYSQLFEDLEKLPHEKNPDFPTIGVALNSNDIDKKLDEVVAELNRGCFWQTEGKLSEKEQIKVFWSTETICGGGPAFIDPDKGHLFIPNIQDQPYDKLVKEANRAKFNFEIYKGTYHEALHFFATEFERVNQLAKADKTKEKTVKEWQTLPEKEKEFIEEKALKLEYKSRKTQRHNKENIVFDLEETEITWEDIKKKKNEQVELQVDDKLVGKILEFNPKAKQITIKDYQGGLENLPEKGTLSEDVSPLTSQYKKQIEACENFQKSEMENPALGAYLANPEELNLNNIEIDHDDFEEKIKNKKLDVSQKEVVIEAFHRKPIFLIQGPPGTGKTTVILELIEQLISKNQDVKILLVSQANLAVDNVLEKLSEEISFVRLASEHALEKDKVLPQIKEHHWLPKKFEKWMNETEERCQKYSNTEHTNSLVSWLYGEFKKEKIDNLEDFKKLLMNTSRFDLPQFKKAKDLEELGGQEAMGLQDIQGDWLKFVRNGASKKGNQAISTLKYGSADIDLETAFAKSMNVIGATCIHIASGTYSDLEFRFDYMIMDESSKATAAESLVPINMSKNLILIGDHKQLPPMITREEAVKSKIKEELEDEGLDIEKIYDVSLFEKIFENFEESEHMQSYYGMLTTQYRMPRQIGHLISKHVYGGKIRNPSPEKVPDYDEQKFHHLPLKRETVSIEERGKTIEVPNSIIFISTSNKENPSDNDNKFKRANPCNIKVIQETLASLNKLREDEKAMPQEIGIIAAYRGQVEQLQNKIQTKEYRNLEIETNTVDSFQGAERDIIIYDVVRSSTANSNIGFLEDYRRINVAFSRAKKLLIVVGDAEYILKRAQLNPRSDIEEFVLKNMTEDLNAWGCIYNNLEEALQ